MIYHIAQKSEWDKQEMSDSYEPSGLAIEGFIHCSRHEQIEGVLSRYYKNAINLVLLHIDETKLTTELKYETGTNQELFPHVFGPINKSAIVRVERLA